MKRIMSIDYGTKWIGIAITDAERKVALPFDVLEYRGDDELVEWLEKFVSEWDVGTIVLGLPIHLSGDESRMSQRVRTIADKIKKRISVSVDLWDERLTSKEAARVISELGKKSKVEHVVKRDHKLFSPQNGHIMMRDMKDVSTFRSKGYAQLL